MINLIKDYKENKLKDKQVKAWLGLSNLYLEIEAGRILLNRHWYNQLNDYLDSAYDHSDDMIRTWWMHEFWKLPYWNNV